ncbi:MAG TPA: cellulase family glycosylhydrolase [Pseudonocardiaceae bacterium]|nr:cellulase family glycosylhydrolase [Pseudonocardiaceae bacterium]
MRRSASKLMVDGARATWLGANFWSRAGGPLMWRTYDAALVRDELRVLREHGLTMTRSFFYWPDFMPEPNRVDETLVARFADFLDAHGELGLRTVPTFLVGHMSGENWDPAWRDGRDLYRDVWLVAQQAWFAKTMTRRFHDHPAVTGWLVSNEMPIYGGSADRDSVSAWAQLIVDAVRAAGGTQPVSLGDGAWGIETTGNDNGFRLRDSVRLCDFLGPHVYRMENDVVRQHYAGAWACELAATFGAPVVLEEFGVSSDFAADEHAAHYYRQNLHNSLLAGAVGWIGWNNTDFDQLADQDPYRHHAFEMHFGLTDATGHPKAQLHEFTAFAEVLRAVDIDRCARPDSDAALVVSSYLESEYPFTDPSDRTSIADALRQAYVSAKLADLPVALTRESDGVAGDARLYLLPATKQLLAPTWHTLERLAEQGSCVYVSYSPGSSDVQRGPWYARLNGMFGVEHQLRYGLIDEIEDEEVVFTLTRDFGGLDKGRQLRFPVSGNANCRAYLPVHPVDAEVLATDAPGRPALLLRRNGSGSILLCTYPIELFAAQTPHANPSDLGVLYTALAEHAQVRRPVTVDDTRVAVDGLVHEDGRRFVWFVSQADAPLTITPRLAAGVGLVDLDGGDPDESVRLPPFGVAVRQIR